jgi:ADP-ribosylglycohydrolase
MAWQLGRSGDLSAERFFEAILERTPVGETRQGLEEAASMGADVMPEKVAERLGSGWRVSSQDTVPFALWCAAHHLNSFEETFWTTVRGLGDRDTTCAIACGVTALAVGEVPSEWLESREPLHLDFPTD